jgi:hypothetical protein
MILTGIGDVFMDEIDGASLGEVFQPGEWDSSTGKGDESCSASWR